MKPKVRLKTQRCRTITRLLGIFLLCSTSLMAQSGGPIHPYQAAYDVQYIELDMEVFPSDSSISATVTTTATQQIASDTWRMALSPRFTIQSIQWEGREIEWVRPNTEDPETQERFIHLEFPKTIQPGEDVKVSITYQGSPRTAVRAPWDGGFVWAETPSGEPWIGVACQGDGAWLWWPNKDHPSDEPDQGVMIHYTVPTGLTAVSNGVLRETQSLGDRTRWSWEVLNPINSYSITLNVAPYIELQDSVLSVDETIIPLHFWVLPEFEERGKERFPQFKDQLVWFEQLLGPYPFRNEKYGVVHAPFLGMEHQTIIAYGPRFEDNNLFGRPVGFDDLHHHELAHEWWGNVVTAWDWRDFWIHEGFGTYMQTLYTEDILGQAAADSLMGLLRTRIVSNDELVPDAFQTTKQKYGSGRGGDIYYKGAWTLHMLRYLLGKDAFLGFMRELIYPTPASRQATDGSQTRFLSTKDVIQVAQSYTDRDLSPFFELYLKHAQLPQLVSELQGRSLTLYWTNVPEGISFSMPVEVSIDGDVMKVEVGLQNPDPTGPTGEVTVQLPRRVEEIILDPNGWLLRDTIGYGESIPLN